ncbi:hypothetical protein ZWY2020_042271 [Hordeum vulgare]|nr:hypothetical protein ZWY2020_042271 [Hordeum vulgare]
MPRFTARAAIIDALKEKGLYRGMENNEMELGRCSRTNDIVEPMIKPQWFVNCNTMAKSALNAVKSKEIEIIPPQYEQDWYRWLENIRDWCISRQLWWGHRVPAWMVMMGMLLHGDVPFQKIYLHPIIRDAHGRKMSKSLGNVIDPIDVINGITLEGLQKKLEQGNLDQGELEKAKEGQKKDFPDGIPECGTDALRFALISYTSQFDKINLDIKRVHGYRQWCNKLWNAIRFAMIKLEISTLHQQLSVHTMPSICKWILSVLSKAVGKTVSSLEAYKFSDATSSIYFWWQYQLCDVFIEAIKPYFNGSQEFESARGASRDTLWACLDTGLRLLHPFMPYITEELWQRLPQPKEAPIFVLCRNLEIAATVQHYQAQIATLASVSSIKILTEDDPAPSDCATDIVNKDLAVYLQLREKYDTLSQKMSASGYREKAPQSKQDDDTKKLATLLAELEIISGLE